MKLSSKLVGMVVLGVSCLFALSASYAVSVVPGSTVALSGTTYTANPDLGGAIIRDQLIPFQVTDTLGTVILSGNVQDRVVRSTNTGNLIFAPRLRDLTNPANVAWVMGFQMNGFDGFTTDIDYRTDGQGDIGPKNVDRDLTGSALTYGYGYDTTLIVPPDEGYFLSVLTDATAFDLSGQFTIFVQNDFGANVFSTSLRDVAAPSTVPVPAAVWLFGSGLVGMLGVGRRKRRLGQTTFSSVPVSLPTGV
ncbi:MAG: hypothetical protein BMS9Abin06_0802 [Gammaproteobacteria bacterium]|nr:MAG: hypothetical protein BMS9Abin06_0802 [Gammaproteobacteria bacterium]